MFREKENVEYLFVLKWFMWQCYCCYWRFFFWKNKHFPFHSCCCSSTCFRVYFRRRKHLVKRLLWENITIWKWFKFFWKEYIYIFQNLLWKSKFCFGRFLFKRVNKKNNTKEIKYECLNKRGKHLRNKQRFSTFAIFKI